MVRNDHIWFACRDGYTIINNTEWMLKINSQRNLWNIYCCYISGEKLYYWRDFYLKIENNNIGKIICLFFFYITNDHNHTKHNPIPWHFRPIIRYYTTMSLNFYLYQNCMTAEFDHRWSKNPHDPLALLCRKTLSRCAVPLRTDHCLRQLFRFSDCL